MIEVEEVLTCAPFDEEANHEAIFDVLVAPLLKQVVEVCAKFGMPFVSTVEFANGWYANNAVVPKGTSGKIRDLVSIMFKKSDEQETGSRASS